MANNKYTQPAASEYDNGLFGLEYRAFNDTGADLHNIAVAIYGQTGSSMDTSGIDHIRQGVEMRTMKHWLGSNQPKIWTGNINHITRLHTYGQARSWTEYDNSITWDDSAIKFDPKKYITDVSSYPSPVSFNGGPMDAEEAIIEPLTILYRLDASMAEGSYPVHSPKGNFEDGNAINDNQPSNNRILQFIEYEAPLTAAPFLDSGQQYIGAGTLANCIIIEGHVIYVSRQGDPFDDTQDEDIVDQLTIVTSTPGSADFMTQLKLLSVNLENDLRQMYTQKSATAGFVIDSANGRYGTDSLAFAGTHRGSTR